MKWIKRVTTTPLTNIAKVIDSLAVGTNARTNAPSIRAVSEEISTVETELSGEIDAVLDTATTGLNALNTRVDEIWETIYPVGAIYMSVNSTSPATLFGGTWEQIVGRFLYASDGGHSSGDTGGSFSARFTPSGTVDGHQLSVSEMPQHRHYYDSAYEGASLFDAPSVGTNNHKFLYNDSGNGDYTDLTGQNQPHTHGFTGDEGIIGIMPPYLTVNMWKRTS